MYGANCNVWLTPVHKRKQIDTPTTTPTPTRANAGDTRGGRAGGTRGADAGDTRGADAGDTRGADAGDTRGADANDPRPLKFITLEQTLEVEVIDLAGECEPTFSTEYLAKLLLKQREHREREAMRHAEIESVVAFNRRRGIIIGNNV